MDETKITAIIDDDGHIKISVYDFLRNMDDEQKKTLISEGGWWSLISDEMALSVVNAFSRKHYNPIYHKLRMAILNSDSMPKMLREWADYEMRARIDAEQGESYWRNAYFKLRSWATGRETGEYSIAMPQLDDRTYKTEIPAEIKERIYKQCQEFGLMFPEKEKD